MPYIDNKLGKYASRKFIGFFVATLLLMGGFIGPLEWTVYASVWVGIQGYGDSKQ